MRNDQQLWYMTGVCCVNLMIVARVQGQSDRILPLHREAITNLETAFRMKPDDDSLRGELGRCWERYAEDLAKAKDYCGAIIALAKSIAHENLADPASPNDSAHRHRLARRL